MVVQVISLLLISMANGMLGLLAFYRQPYRSESQLFALYMASIGLWPFSMAMFMLEPQYGPALFWAQFAAAALPGMVLLLILFLHAFTTPKSKQVFGRYLILTAPLLILIGAMIVDPSYIIGGLDYSGDAKALRVNSAGLTVYASIFFAYSLGALYMLYRHSRLTSGPTKIQLRMLLYGIITALIIGGGFDILMVAGGEMTYIWLGPLFTIPYVVLVMWAMIKHNLFDVRLMVARSLTYLLVGAVLLAIYAGIGLLLGEQISGQALTGREKAVYASLAVGLSMLFPIARRLFSHLTNRLFYRRSYDAQAALDFLSKRVVNEIDLEHIAEHTKGVIRTNLKPSFVQFVMVDDGVKVLGKHRRNIDYSQELLTALKDFDDLLAVTGQIDRHDPLHHLLHEQQIAIAVRLLVQDKPAGYIVLGAPRSGGGFRRQDYRFLSILGRELSLSIQNARRFDEVKQLNDSLQERVHEATKELRESNAKLKELDEAKDEFVSMASHQLRTPLTSIKGYVSMIMEGDAGKLNKQQHDLLEAAFASSQRMVYLIADLLNASRLKTGKFIIEPAEVDLREVIATEIKQLQETAATRELELTYQRPDNFPTVMLDINKIHQVIMNFIDNAIYYTKAGGKIQVILESNEKSITFKVVDNGIGVPNSEKHKLFSKFYRADNARKARPDGTGLGLFMAQKIVIEQHGAIIFESEEGKGSTFGFTFPLDKIGLKGASDDPGKQQVEQ